MSYSVVVCSNCENAWIVKNRPERTKCPRCEKTYKFKELKKFAKFENKEQAREARGYTQAVVNEYEEEYEKLKEEGKFKIDEDTGISPKEFLKEKGVDPEEIQSTPKPSQNKPEKIQNIIQEKGTPTKQEIINQASEENISPEEVEKILTRMQQKGYLLKTPNNNYRLL